MVDPNLEALVLVPAAQLHQVENGIQTLVAVGELNISLVGTGNAEVVRAQVGSVTWNLGKHLPALKAAPTIYSFGLEHTRHIYYCLILPPDTPSVVLEAVEDVLVSSCAFSTVRQVDAAYEQADKLSGGKAAKEAKELAGRQDVGAGPAAGAAPPGATVTGVPAVAVPGSAAATGYAGTPAAAPASAGGHGAAGHGTPYAAAQAPPEAAQVAPNAAGAVGGAAGQARPKLTAVDRVASGILVAGSVVAGLVKKGSDSMSEAIQNYKERQMASPPPHQGTGRAAKVSPHFKRGLKVVAVVASGAAYVTGRLAALVGDASYALALAIAKALPGHDDRKAAEGAEIGPEEKSAFKTVGAAGLVAYVQVYDALENAAKQVLTHSAEATAQYIQYKYGPEAGAAAADSVPVAQDMLQAAINSTRLGARALISKTAKKTAKIYLKSTMAGIHPDDQAAARRNGSTLRVSPLAPGAATGTAANAVPAAPANAKAYAGASAPAYA